MGKRGEKMQAEVLSIMRGEKSSLSAYDLLDELRGKYPKIAPPIRHNNIVYIIFFIFNFKN